MSTVPEKVDLDPLDRAAQARLAELRARRQQLSIDGLANRRARGQRVKVELEVGECGQEEVDRIGPAKAGRRRSTVVVVRRYQVRAARRSPACLRENAAA